jgi:hypothetical protein
MLNTYIDFEDHPEGRLRLKVLHKVVYSGDKFFTGTFRANCTNTLLIDPSPESSYVNNPWNAIFPLSYIGSPHDSIKRALQPYLRGLLESGLSVTQYVSRNPFIGNLNAPLKSNRLANKVQHFAFLQDNFLVPAYGDIVGPYSKVRSDFNASSNGRKRT